MVSLWPILYCLISVIVYTENGVYSMSFMVELTENRSLLLLKYRDALVKGSKDN
ncbi:MAG: hypothetical protein ACI9ES_002165 [Oceanospirillaceae bacterium]|jgi:hypothetical protein